MIWRFYSRVLKFVLFADDIYVVMSSVNWSVLIKFMNVEVLKWSVY